MSDIKPLSIAGEEFYPGQSGVVKLEAGQLPSGTLVDIKLRVFRSFRPGPIVLLLAGVHGDEINGVEILRRTLRQKLYDDLTSGTVLVVPLLNVYGFNNFSRDVPDGKDVNRSFPGSATGSLASRIAATLSRQVLSLCDLALDFHTGGRGVFNYPQIRYTPGDTRAQEAARTFGSPVMLAAKGPRRSLRHSAARAMGLGVLTFEGGENHRYDGFSIDEGVKGTHRLLAARGMLPTAGAPPPRQSIHCTGSSWVRAGRSGLFRWTKRSGHPVRKGEPIGIISDPHDQRPQRRILCPRDGFIIGHTNVAVVGQGDALFHIGF